MKRWAQKDGFDLQDIEGKGGTCWRFYEATV
jgi:hypothetical protein